MTTDTDNRKVNRDHTDAWFDNVYGWITDEYTTQELRAVIQTPQPPPVGNMDTEGVWTLAWDDHVTNSWAEAFPTQTTARFRLAELIDAVDRGVSITPYEDFLDSVVGTNKALNLRWRHYLERIADNGYHAEIRNVEWGAKLFPAAVTAVFYPTYTTGPKGPLIEVWAWEEPDPDHHKIVVADQNGTKAVFTQAAPLSEAVADNVARLLDCMGVVGRQWQPNWKHEG